MTISFDDLSKPVIVDVHVTPLNGLPFVVPMYCMTWAEWNDCVDDILNPAVPRTFADKSGNKLPNFNDVQYLQKLGKVNEKRRARRLTFALTRAGMVIPGAALPEQTENVQSKLEFSVASALSRWQEDMIMKASAASPELAEFHPLPNGREPDFSPVEEDAAGISSAE